MKKGWLIIIIGMFVIGCSKQSELEKIFNCEATNTASLKEITDFNKNFKIGIPTTWKTNLYYDEFQSEIFTADTTKQLTEAYILNTSFNYGKLLFTPEFYAKNDSIFKSLNFEKKNSGTIQFQEKPSYWQVVKGEKNGFPYQQFNLYVILSEDTYFNAVTEIYGETTIDERICESISIINHIEFLQ
jgi:hypothetical protein